VDSEERVRRMEEDGLVSPEQAALLRESLGNRAYRGAAAPASLGPTHATVRWLLITCTALVLMALVGWFVFLGEPGVPELPQDVAQTLNQPEELGLMNRTISVVLAVALLLALPLVLWTWLYNSLVSKEEAVLEAWAQTESTYQRRTDLIPALVETISRYLKHERETLGEVSATRGEANAALSEAVEKLAAAEAKASRMGSERGGGLIEDETALAQLAAAESAVETGLKSVIAIAEDYPELRSSDQFLELQAQLEGTENRINVARLRFNEKVRAFNAAIRHLPGSLVAGIGNFRRKAYFQAEEGTDRALGLEYD